MMLRRLAHALGDLEYAGRWHVRSRVAPASPRRFRRGSSALPTIVALAGVFERWDFLIPVLDHLNRLGYPIHVIERLGRNRGAIADLATEVVRELHARDIQDAVIVGHSKGGLVGKAVMLLANTEWDGAGRAARSRDEEELRPPRVHGLVAISTPFAGTRLVDFVGASRELRIYRPDSPELISLAEHDAFDDRIVCILPKTDEIVTDPGTLPRGRVAMIPVHGHARLLGDPRTHLAVERSVALLAREGRARCVRSADAAPARALAAGPHAAPALAPALASVPASAPVSVPEARSAGAVSPSALGRREELARRRRAPSLRLGARARDYRWAASAYAASLRRDARVLDAWRSKGPGGADVVLVPGVLERWGFLRGVGERLHAEGHAVHVVEGLGWNRGTFEEAADELERVLEERDLRDVVVVAHSKGGLIAKTCLMREADLERRTGEPPRVRHVVAIASPFQGSAYARLFLDPALRAFSPTSAPVRRMGRDVAANARITAIAPAFDPHIPGERALAGAARNIELAIDGHFEILGDERLLDEVAAVVRAHAPAQAHAHAPAHAPAPAPGTA